MFAVFWKEFTYFFKTPLGYFYLGVSLLISGLLFTIMNLAAMSADFTVVLNFLQVLLIFTTPLLTMRLFSEEKRQHTDQLLLTAPVPLWQIVLGKIKASLAIFFLTILGMLPYLIVIEIFGTLDWGRTMAALLGYILLGGLYISVGAWVSTWSPHQMIVAIATFCVLFCLWFAQPLLQNLPKTTSMGLMSAWLVILLLGWFFYKQTAQWRYGLFVMLPLTIAYVLLYFFQRDFFKDWLYNTLAWGSITARYGRFLMGSIGWGDLAYFIGLIAFMGYLTIWRLEKERWSSDI